MVRQVSKCLSGKAGKQVLKLKANFSKVFEVLSSNDGPNFIQI